MSKTIVKAAIKVKDKIFTGFDHGECFSQAQFPIPVKDLEQGFIDSEGNFVDRKQAMIIAKQAEQLRYETDKQTLISEDIHLDWLNKQAERITELKEQLVLTEKALELVCEELDKIVVFDAEFLESDSFYDYYLKKAKEMIDESKS